MLGDSDEDFAKVVIGRVVKTVKQWHEQHPDSLGEIEDSPVAWNMLLKTLGKFRAPFKSLDSSLSTLVASAKPSSRLTTGFSLRLSQCHVVKCVLACSRSTTGLLQDSLKVTIHSKYT